MAEKRIILGMPSTSMHDYAKGLNEHYEVICLNIPADVCFFARRYRISTAAIVFEANFLLNVIRKSGKFIEDINQETTAPIIVFCDRLYSPAELEQFSAQVTSVLHHPAPPHNVLDRILALQASKARHATAEQPAAS